VFGERLDYFRFLSFYVLPALDDKHHFELHAEFLVFEGPTCTVSRMADSAGESSRLPAVRNGCSHKEVYRGFLHQSCEIVVLCSPLKRFARREGSGHIPFQVDE
jgi:hypothetical protein